MGSIVLLEKKKRREKQEASVQKLVSGAPAALEKLVAKKEDVQKLTKKEICSLLLTCYGTLRDDAKNKKLQLVELLRDKIASEPEKIRIATPTDLTAAPASVILGATTLAAGGEDGDEDDEGVDTLPSNLLDNNEGETE